MVVGCNEQRTRIWKLGKGRGREGERGEGDRKRGRIGRQSEKTELLEDNCIYLIIDSNYYNI